MLSHSESRLEAPQAASLAVSKKLFPRPLPKAMTAYAMDVDHLLIAEEPLKELEERALAKGEVEVAEQGDTYVLRLPEKLYAFYRLDENDYTIMVSEREPLVLVVAL